MKKNIITLALSSLILLGFSTSCSFLEEDLSTQLTPDNYFKTQEEFEAAITPIYSYIFKNNSRFGGLGTYGYTVNAGDQALTSPRGLNKQRMLEFDNFNVSNQNPDVEGLWYALYRGVSAANNVLENLDRIATIPMDDQLRKSYISEVYFLRAFAYYNLAIYWKEVPIMTKNLNGQEAVNVKKSSMEDVFTFVLSDLEKAGDLPESQNVDKSRPNLDAVRLLKSYVYLNMAGYPLEKGVEYYQKAADQAKLVIESGSHFLETSYADLWRYDNRFSKEHIFAFYGDFSSGRNYGSYGNKSFRGTEEGGWKDFVVTNEFYRNFPKDNRIKSCIYDTIMYDKKGKALAEENWSAAIEGKELHTWIGKYRDIGGANWNEATSNAIYPIFRYADALLVFAEASNKANGGPSAEAYSALHQIQDRAYLGTDIEDHILAAGADEATFDQVVLQERAWEFAFENKTWNDNVRRERVIETNMNHDDEEVGFDPNSITESRYYAPVPERESSLNPNLNIDPDPEH
ncbi:RagB/SusD family nutrient uptake outer membrane protein [Halosquirtibacter xylanolyticus]|uniref:RagB/SusD family nutrient uptake outer membrane protein n=1 Tax=Halosquirtibacter xylanolyticus TaxID=3374599 RepID=UPI003747CD44|nr:RagB/SusD family nutrient uptake outer membrane protein [Prolixibacteraceae bacterium]